MKHDKINRISGIFFVSLLLLALCFSSAGASKTGTAPLGAELQNASYTGFSVTDNPVTLKDGTWQGEPYDEDGASRPEIKLLAGTYPIADFDGDGSEDAAVLLTESGGGTGTFHYLAVVVKKDGKLHNIATTMLGDRLQIIEFGAENGVIAVKVVQAGPNDPAGYPADFVTRSFTLKGSTLEEEQRVDKADRLSPDVMAGATWVLAEWNPDEPAPQEPEISLAYKGGRFTGFSGCNRYFTDVTAGEMAGSILVGMVGTTRMICSPSIDAAEMRFHELLAEVTGFGFDSGRLVLSYSEGESGAALFFKRKQDGAVK